MKKMLMIAFSFGFAISFQQCKTSKETVTDESKETVKVKFDTKKDESAPANSSATSAYYSASVLPILQAKCNGCHKNKYNAPTFTETSMKDEDAKKGVHQTVFISKSMPKGNVTLSDEEQKILKYWIANKFE